MISEESSNMNGKLQYYINKRRQIDLMEWLIVNMYGHNGIARKLT